MARCIHCHSCLSYRALDNDMTVKINSRPMFDDSVYLNGLFIGWIFITTFTAMLMFSKFEDDLQNLARQEEAILTSECRITRSVAEVENEYLCKDGTTKIRGTP